MSSVSAPARNGVAMTMMIEVARMAHTNSGICQMPMPAGRMLRMVTMKLIAPRMDEMPSRCSDTAHIVWPSPGLNSVLSVG